MKERVTLCELRDREVISASDGKRLGFVCDAEIDVCTGKVCALIIPGEMKLPLFSKTPDICIPWECVERIGDDVLLVNSGGIFPIEKRGRGVLRKKQL